MLDHSNTPDSAYRYKPGMLGRDFVIPRARGLKGLYLDYFGVPDVRVQLTARYLLAAIADLPFTTVMDAGCGNGMLTCLMALRYPERTFVGVDVNEQSIAYARQLAEQNGLANVTFQAVDIDRCIIEGKFDLIVSLAVMQFIEDVPGLISRFASSLESGGHLVLQLPVSDCSHILMRSSFARSRLPQFNEVRAGFSKEEVEALLTRRDFGIELMRPVIKGRSVLAKEIFYLALSLHRSFSFALCPVLNWVTVRDDDYSGEPAGLFVVAHKAASAL
jgi:trans-aconitate methyltransferase